MSVNYHRPTDKQLMALIAFVTQWGWDIAIEDGADEDLVHGMVIGTPEFIDGVIGEEREGFTIYDSETPTGAMQ